MSKLLIALFFLLIPMSWKAQDFAKRDYYLVDSLVLEELSDNDLELLETALKKYHAAKSDTAKISALSSVCNFMNHNIWGEYQSFQLALINSYLIRENLSNDERQALSIKKAIALNNLGYFHDMKGNVSVALKFHFKSLKVCEEINHELGIARSYNQLGVIYENYLEDPNQALEYYTKSLAVSERIGDKENIAISYNNIGVIHKQRGELEEAKMAYQKSLDIKREIGSENGIAQSLLNLGGIYEALKDYDTALDLYEQSLEIRQKLDDKYGIAQSLNHIGSAQYDIGLYGIAEQNLLKALSASEEFGSVEWTKHTSQRLSQLYEKTGRHAESLSYYKVFIKFKDSLNKLEFHEAAIKQEAQHTYEKQKALDKVENDKKLALEQEEKEKQKLIIYAIGVVLLLTAIFLFFIFNRLKITKIQKSLIEEAHHRLEEKNTEILDSINYAKRIQSAILPPEKLIKEHLQNSFILYKPKDIVAGDFYWMEPFSEGVLFAAADCTGHGVPGAMVSVVCNHGLNRAVREYGLTDPAQILDKTREIVIQEFEKSEEEVKDGMDIALCSLKGFTLQYAGAHNPLWIIRSKEVSQNINLTTTKGVSLSANESDGYSSTSCELIEIKANKQPIGKFNQPLPYTTHTVELKQGDSFYIFSDGYADQFGGEKGKKLKAKNFKSLLLSIHSEPMIRQKELIDEAFEKWKGSYEQLDDICVIGVKL